MYVPQYLTQLWGYNALYHDTQPVFRNGYYSARRCEGPTVPFAHSDPPQYLSTLSQECRPQHWDKFIPPHQYAMWQSTPICGATIDQLHQNQNPRYSNAPHLKRSHSEKIHCTEKLPHFHHGVINDDLFDQKASGRSPRRTRSTTRRRSTLKEPSSTKSTPKATKEDARRAGIPSGYSYKNWDPAEQPIFLLRSVFDANSIGKWIYDWTIFHYGPATPHAEIASELWLLLIQLAEKIKTAKGAIPKIRKKRNRRIVEGFVDSGQRLWARFADLLGVCEKYMLEAAKKESGTSGRVFMGKSSGCEFVDSIFGRDRELERTEKFMVDIRLWSTCFNAKCEDIFPCPFV